LNPIVFSPIFDSYWYEVIDILDKKFGYLPLMSYPIIHYRKGDYKKNKTHKRSFVKELPVDYYLSSIKYLEKKYSQKIDKVFLISDEIKISYKELSPFIKEIKYNDKSLVEYDLWLLSRSKDIIMSNSTLSCVGAHLAKLRGTLEISICPEQWFCDISKNGSRYDLRKNKWKRI
jgi:hypothetical protein